MTSQLSNSASSSEEVEIKASLRSPTPQWYSDKKTRGLTEIKQLQLHKKQVPPYHEYIVLFCDSRPPITYRLDRNARGEDNLILALGRSGIQAVDTIRLDRGYRYDNSTCLAGLQFHQPIDLSVILLICFKIQEDDQGSKYTASQFNCYFFSQTILAAVARHVFVRKVMPTNDLPGRALAQIKFKGEVNECGWATTRTLSPKWREDLLQQLREKLWRDGLCTLEPLSVQMVLRCTLWRDCASSALKNALDDTVRDMKRHLRARGWRNDWVKDYSGMGSRSELAIVWEAAWRDIWGVVWQQIRAEIGQPMPGEWETLWDNVCGGTNLDQSGTIMVLGKNFTEIQLQDYIWECINEHSAAMQKLGVRCSPWQIKAAMTRVWVNVVRINPGLENDVFEFIKKPNELNDIPCKQKLQRGRMRWTLTVFWDLLLTSRGNWKSTVTVTVGYTQVIRAIEQDQDLYT